MITVVVADDQELVRTGVALVLDAQPDLAVVAQAADGADALSAVRAHHPDVAVLDLRMPRLDGIEVTRRILRDGLRTRVLVLTMFDEEGDVVAALQAGASGYLLKDAPREALTAAVRGVNAGGSALSPSVTMQLLAHVRQPHAPRRIAGLTDREADVLRVLATGASNAEIAETLRIGEATVKTHVARLLAKTGSRDRVQLVVAAYEAGFVGNSTSRPATGAQRRAR